MLYVGDVDVLGKQAAADCLLPTLAFDVSRGVIQMPQHIKAPTIVRAAGNKPKIIEEYVGRLNTQTEQLSIARMKSPNGWVEPGQTPEFDEFTVVLKGMLRVETKDEILDVNAGEAIIARAGEWIRYSTPAAEGAEYVAICLPAFSPDTVHRGD
jgi:mannose-6-phosphate isomerase-like protein (cupin superfamily)